jgi:hypothetical protein
MTIWSILWPLEIFHGHLVHFVFVLYIFCSFGITYQKNLAGPETVASFVCGTFRWFGTGLNTFRELNTKYFSSLTLSSFRKLSGTIFMQEWGRFYTAMAVTADW